LLNALTPCKLYIVPRRVYDDWICVVSESTDRRFECLRFLVTRGGFLQECNQ
jgi:hypothetical protein